MPDRPDPNPTGKETINQGDDQPTSQLTIHPSSRATANQTQTPLPDLVYINYLRDCTVSEGSQ